MTTAGKPRLMIVNSSSFGKYSGVLDVLNKYFEVSSLTVNSTARGKELASAVGDVDIIVASTTPYYDREFFDNVSSRLRGIVRHGIGIDNIDLEAALKRGVKVVKVPGEVERESVAEHTIALLLAALRKLVHAHLSVVNNKWRERARFVGLELKGKCAGVVGFGNIGSRVAELLRAFGVRVMAYDPYVQPERIRSMGCEPASFEDIVRECDILTFHVPLTRETYHMVNMDVVSRMKRGVIIVNTSRGEVLSNDALIWGLENGIISALALDVIEGEPIGSDHPLLKYDNVVVTPHIAAYTHEALKAMDEYVAREAIRIMYGDDYARNIEF